MKFTFPRRFRLLSAVVLALGAAVPAALLTAGAGNPYWEAQHRAAAEAGRRLGFTFKAVSGNLNPQDQANIMRQLVNQHPTVIMLNSIDPKAMVPAVTYAKSKGEVAVMSGILGQPASDLRAKGFTDYMKTQKGVKVDAVQPTNWAADKASAAMQDFLVKFPNLGFVYTLSDTLALPAANIADRQGKLCTQQKNWKD